MNYVLSPVAVAKLRRLLGGVLGNALTPSASPATVSPDDFPAPYTVRWAQSVDNGSGSWIIYLVNNDVLRISGETIPVTTRLTAAGNPYPAGWYKIPSSVLSSTGGNLWLVVDKGIGIAGFSGNAGSSDTWSFHIALCWRSTTTLETGVVQLVNSAIIFDNGGGGSGTVEFVADVDWYYDSSYHVLRKRLRVLDLSTGAITDKPNTTFANGWEIAAPSTPISSIIN